ncbi:hypothetical protein [Chamaesiphon sp. GL140_3_metabinner_50]|uniref:hypothetical protein n=1 Tax=Chamaesiphon sp. GL140_3_metabinner_50 TaxID=2970812 RepID=UPI0025E4ED02|nr:hypothetical protein [Chamaesiphon sp. GL140_3_metabinner_50]
MNLNLSIDAGIQQLRRQSSRTRSILALLLIVPISSIGALTSTIIAPGAVGQGIAVCCGMWMLIFPVAWHVSIDRQRLQFNKSLDGLAVGIILGVAMFATIFVLLG